MPPSHRLLASRLQGYVCRACLSKSKINVRQQPRWLSRDTTKGAWRTRLKGASNHLEPQNLKIRLFEQAPDGTRVEIPTDSWSGMEEDLQGYENDESKIDEELVDRVDIESLLDGDRQQSQYDPMIGGQSLEEMTKSTEELEALIERLENIDFSTLSTDDRNKLWDELLESGATGM